MSVMDLFDASVISVCTDCVYFNAYGRLDDETMSRDSLAADRHKAKIAAAPAGWSWGTQFTPGCGRDCEEHGLAAHGGDEEAYEADAEAGPETWFSWSPCEQCGYPLGGTREHATAFTYKKAD